jgi:hypothetical protein
MVQYTQTSNLAELAKGRQVIAVHLQAHGRTPDTDRPLRCETLGDDAREALTNK